MFRLFAGAVLVLAGCADAMAPDIGGIELTLSLSQEEVVIGDTVEIRVVATNVSENEVSFTTNTCVLVVRILDESSTPLVTFPDTCNDIAVGTTIAPGDSIERIVQFDTSVGSGIYSVRAGISDDLLNVPAAADLRVRP